MGNEKAAPTRARQIEACDQAANLYERLSRDRITRGTAAALRAAARTIERGGGAERPPSAAPGPALEALLAAVSTTIGLRERAKDGRWLVDEEQMNRLEASYAPMRKALLAPIPVHPGAPDDCES